MAKYLIALFAVVAPMELVFFSPMKTYSKVIFIQSQYFFCIVDSCALIFGRWTSIKFYALKSEFSKPKIINSSNSMSTNAWNPRTRKSSKAWKLHYKIRMIWCVRMVYAYNEQRPAESNEHFRFSSAYSSNENDYVVVVCLVGSLLACNIAFCLSESYRKLIQLLLNIRWHWHMKSEHWTYIYAEPLQPI